MKIIKKNLVFILILQFSFYFNAYSQVLVNWATETGLGIGSTFVDGQIINNFAGTGLTAQINVITKGGTPLIATDGTIAAIGPSSGNAAGATFTLSFLNGNANINLDNKQNLIPSEDIWVSNPDGLPITITQTSSSTTNGRIQADGISINSNPLPQSITSDSNVEITTTISGIGNTYYVNMNAVSGFTWLYETNGNFEGFTLTISNAIVLPIELTAFEVSETHDHKAEIFWETASELNNDYFSIEKSIDGIIWENIVDLKAVGQSNETNRYKYIDKSPFLNNSYYRLKQTDFDGKYKYSQVRNINIESSANTQIDIYPNPTINYITIVGNSSELMDLSIYNTLGQNVTWLTQRLESNPNKIVLDLTNLSKGIYYIRTKTKAIKVYKQ
jgi:hypothetical protein